MKRIQIVLSLVLISLALGAGVVWAQSGVQFSETETSIDFPNSISFSSHVQSSGSDIVKAQFVYYLDRLGASDSTTRENLDIEPGPNIDLHYTWDTSKTTVLPWSPIVFYWRVTDAQGNVYESEPQKVYYRDTRFNWQERANDQVVVLWHDKPADFGDKVFEIAQQAIQKQEKIFGRPLTIPIRIIIYNSPQEFSAWHSVALDWVGGEAFPDFGLTTQIVSSDRPDQHWLKAVIPHEISHLYLYQTAHNASAPIPVWLNEGLAQYNEFIDSGTDYLVEQAVKENRLLPLTSLAAGFGQHDEARIRLSYAEALSAVRYLAKTYGEAGISRLLAAYRQGLTTEDAFRTALGISMGQFQQDWAVSVGARAESMITPTPWPKPTFRPPPTPMQFGNGNAATPGPTASPEPTPTPHALAATPTPEPTNTPAPTPAPAPPGKPLCPGLIMLLPLPLAAIVIKQKRSA